LLILVFVLLLLHLSACFESLWLVPYPIVAIKNYGSMECMCVCVYKSEYLAL
jgi:hypothetical protein